MTDHLFKASVAKKNPSGKNTAVPARGRTWNGIEYPTLSEAYAVATRDTPRAPGKSTVFKRVQDGQSLDAALVTSDSPQGVPAQGRTWKGVEYPTFAQAFREMRKDVPSSATASGLYRRVSAGASLAEAVAAVPCRKSPRPPAPTTWRGTEYPSLSAACRAAAQGTRLSPECIQSRVAVLGWSLERAATTPVVSEEEGLVYKIQHRATGLVYIGKTKVNGLAERIALHVNWAKKGRGAEGSLHDLIRKYGIEAFEVSVLEERAVNALEAERRYIAQYDSFNSGLNRSAGGERGGGRGRRIKFQGVWYEGFADLVEKRLGSDSLEVLHRGYKVLRGRLNHVPDEEREAIVERALIAVRVKPERALFSGWYRGRRYSSLEAFLSEIIPDAPESWASRVLRLLEKYRAPPYLMGKVASLEAALDALRHPTWILHRLSTYAKAHGHCRVPQDSSLHRSVQYVLRTSPANVEFVRRIADMQFSAVEVKSEPATKRQSAVNLPDVRPKGPYSWHCCLSKWCATSGAPEAHLAEWANSVLAARATRARSTLPSDLWREEVARAARKKAGILKRRGLEGLRRGTPRQQKVYRRVLRDAVQQQYGTAQAGAYFFPFAELWLREACFPLPRAFSESDMVVRRIVKELGVREVFQLPLRAALRLLTERQLRGDGLDDEAAIKLTTMAVYWCPSRKRYRQLLPGFEHQRILAKEAKEALKCEGGERDEAQQSLPVVGKMSSSKLNGDS